MSAGRPIGAGRQASAADVSLRGLSRSFGDLRAVDRVDLDLHAGGITALLGPSGCGKSTLLGMVAGLVEPDAGDVAIDGRSMAGLGPERRPVGLVFQQPLLFAHLSVVDNVAFGLRMQKVPRDTARERARALLDQVGLAGAEGRRVGELSGGQEQRVALARALAPRPRLMLLDEPFSQLDPELRAQMRQLVCEVVADVGITTVFVTHDLTEATEMADDVCLMLDGRIVGQGTAEAFYSSPPSLEAARFFGARNEIVGTVTSARFTAPGMVGEVPANGMDDGAAVLVVRPERLRPADSTPPAPDDLVLEARGVRSTFAGTYRRLTGAVGPDASVECHAPVDAAPRPPEILRLHAGADDYRLFPRPEGHV